MVIVNEMEACIVVQVKGGSIFDNVLICDDPDYAKQVVEEVFAYREVNSVFRFDLRLIYFSSISNL